MTDVLIIGAGATGLSAARILSKARKSVTILEARDRIGGRINTIQGEGFSFPVEAGAEFIHGDLRYTQSLLKEANVSCFSGGGRTWNIESNRLTEGDLFHNDWEELLKKLGQLDHDMPIGKFLDVYFKEPKHRSLVNAVRKFVEGYDAADIYKASALALREEWSNENVQGYRPNGGYSQLMDYLGKETQMHHGETVLSTFVKLIKWKSNYVEVVTSKREIYTARAVLITVPVSLLKKDLIEFDPPLHSHRKALQDLEVGEVVKFLVEFRERIWERGANSPFRQMPNLNFLFSDAIVPTWWTQRPHDVPLLTGWLAGPVLKTLPFESDALLQLAFQSLGYIFGTSEQKMREEIKTIKVINWQTDPLAQGAYAYSTVKTAEAVKIILRPLENTIYFAGEALYEGAEMGTVEAALAMGTQIAEKIISQSA
jgi:monoamine oxidase